MLLINCSNRERNCFSILKKLQKEDDKLISLSNKKIDFCLGCECCQKELPKHCVLDDYITNNVYDEILKEDNIIFASPMYMSNINGILKNLLDRFNTFYNHKLLKGKKFYLIMTGYATKEENEEEIKGIIEYFNGITEYMYFDFEFLDYFVDSEDPEVKIENDNKIKEIKEKLNQ
jgi:multimeric flavodoxin WrbA